MLMNSGFSRGYGEGVALTPRVVCCCSNTDSADVLLLQQRVPVRIMGQYE